MRDAQCVPRLQATGHASAGGEGTTRDELSTVRLMPYGHPGPRHDVSGSFLRNMPPGFPRGHPGAPSQSRGHMPPHSRPPRSRGVVACSHTLAAPRPKVCGLARVLGFWYSLGLW